MIRVVLTSVKGAPGVTTASMLLAGCLPDPVVVEADLDGGVLAVRHELGREPGLTTLAAARSNSPHAWREHAQEAMGIPVLVGPDTPALAGALWQRAGSTIVDSLAAADANVVVDAGRGRLEAMGVLLDLAAQVVILARPRADDLVAVSHRLRDLPVGSTGVGVVLVGDGPYRPSDVATQLGVPVLTTLPWDPRSADTLAGGRWVGRRLARSELGRAARQLADAVLTNAGSLVNPAEEVGA